MKQITFIKTLTIALFLLAGVGNVWGQSNPNNWTGDSGIDTYQESTIIQQGTYSAKVDVKTGTQANCDMRHDEVSVTAGNTYSYSFYIQSSAHVKARVLLEWTGASITYGDYSDISTSSFIEVVYSGTVPSGATGVKVGLRFYDQSGFSSPETQYVDNFTFESPTGTPIILSNGNMESWPASYDPEPTNHPTAFAAAANSNSQITASWTDAIAGDQAPSGYLVMANKTGTFTNPVDGNAQADDLDWGDGEAVKNITHGAKGSFAWTNLDAATQYFFKIFPYNGSGDLINYKTDETVPTADATTETNFDNDTEVFSPITQIAAKSIASTADTQGEAEDVFTISIEDQGSGDGEPTKVTNIRLKPHSTNTADWTNTIQDVFVDDDTDFIYPTATITDTYIDLAFGAADLNVADNSSVDVTVWIYLNTSGIVDGDIISFMVDADDHGFTADATGSGFVSPFTLGDFNSNDMTIDVTFDEIRFTQQPTTVNLGVAISPAVTVAMTDENGNIDTDASGTSYTVGLSTTGSFDEAATTSVDAVNGVVTFDNLIFDAEGTGITLTTTDPDSHGWSNISSDGFDVTDAAQTGDVIINEIDMNGDPGYQQEAIELLIVNGPISLRNWVLREDSDGNEVVFADNAVWDAVPIGTAIAIYVRSGSGTTEDVDYSDGSMTVNVDGIYISGTLQLASNELFYLFRGPSSEGNAIDAVNCGETVSNNYGLTIPDIGSGANKYFVNGSSYNNDDASDWFAFTVTQRTFGDMNPGQGNNPYVFDGSTDNDWNTGDNWSFDDVPNMNTNVTIPAAKTSVEIAADAMADCNNLTLNGSLTVKSDATGTGSLLVNGIIDGSGTTTIQRYVTGGQIAGSDPARFKYHLLSIPLDENIEAGDVFTGTYLWHFVPNQTDENSWTGISSLSEDLDNQKGFLSYVAENEYTFSFTGNMNNGSFTTAAETIPAGEFKLIPNPYPSAIDWDLVDKTDIENAVYFYNSATGNYVSYLDGDLPGGTQFIPAGQAVFVEAKNTNPTITFDNSVRVHNGQPFYKDANQAYKDVLKIAVSANNSADAAFIRFRELADNNYNGFDDASKLRGFAGSPQLYTQSADEKALSINTLATSQETVIVPLAYELEVAGEAQLSFEYLETFDPTVTIFLEDLLLDKMIDLREQSTYSFEHAAENDPLRFKIHFMGVTNVNELASTPENFTIWASEEQLYIHTNTAIDGDLQIELFDLSGRLLDSSRQPMQTPNSISLPDYEGIIMVRVRNNSYVQTQKVFIR